MPKKKKPQFDPILEFDDLEQFSEVSNEACAEIAEICKRYGFVAVSFVFVGVAKGGQRSNIVSERFTMTALDPDDPAMQTTNESVSLAILSQYNEALTRAKPDAAKGDTVN